jgi:hypothetical protein
LDFHPSAQGRLEEKKRVEQLLLKLLPERQPQRDLHAIRVLEALGTSRVERLLETVSEGDFGTAQADWAKQALERLGH